MEGMSQAMSTKRPLDVLRETINVGILKLKSVYGGGARGIATPLQSMRPAMPQTMVIQGSDGNYYHEPYLVPDESVGEEWPEVQEYY